MSYLIFQTDKQFDQGDFHNHIYELSKGGSDPDCWSSEEALDEAIDDAKRFAQDGKGVAVVDSGELGRTYDRYGKPEEAIVFHLLPRAG